MKHLFLKIFMMACLIFASGLILFNYLNQPTPASPNNAPPINQVNNKIDQSINQENQTIQLFPPLNRALERVTKKPFGIFITPQNSPVQPERFQGYHTGVDFETFPEEQDMEVPVYAVCSGPLVLKKSAAGYGGVLVESCNVDNQSVTIIYGHLKLSSINKKVGDNLTKGEKIGVLGAGYSTETDGERKHLHLGIHLGNQISLLGYVDNVDELKNWLDPLVYLD